jgi:hypothetical protein
LLYSAASPIKRDRYGAAYEKDRADEGDNRGDEGDHVRDICLPTTSVCGSMSS